MSWGEEEKKEIERMRERKMRVKLWDGDCEGVGRKCGEDGVRMGEVIENFVGDLVGGSQWKGSDERDYGEEWFEGCWFGMLGEGRVVNELLNLGYEGEDYVDMLEKVERIKWEIEMSKEKIGEGSDEWKEIVYEKQNDDRRRYECVGCQNSVDEYIGREKEVLERYKGELEEGVEEVNDMREEWKGEKEGKMEEEMEVIKKWVKEREEFMNE